MSKTGIQGIGNLLCVANFPANTGFAWTFIEGLFADLARRLAPAGVATNVAYPKLDSTPDTLQGSPAKPIELGIDLDETASVNRLIGAIRDRQITAVYFCDRPTFHRAYARLRKAGVRSIIVHDHSSGARSRPGPLKMLAKRALHAVPSHTPDRLIAVSDFVARRLVETNGCPPERVIRIWNSVVVPTTLPSPEEKRDLLTGFGIDPARPVVGCASRATGVKGIFELLRAFDRLWSTWNDGPKPQLIYMGDGPALPDLHAAHESLASRDSMILPGYVRGAADVLGSVDVAVVPSLWHEAFGLAVLEPLSRGVPVVASRVGGIPEVIDHDETGVLVDPGDEMQIADALGALLREPERRRRMGTLGRARAFRDFDRTVQMDQLESLFRSEMAL